MTQNHEAVARGIAGIQLIKATGGIIAGAILIYLGVSGNAIPKDGIPASATVGRMLGERGVNAVAIALGVLAVVACVFWMRSALRILRRKPAEADRYPDR